MSPKGGKREGSGRKSLGKPTTKITVYTETHKLISDYAKAAGLPVSGLLYHLVQHKEFENFLKKVLKSIEGKNWFEE